MKWGAGLLAFAPADGPMANCVASGKVIEILGSSLPEMTMLFAGSWRKASQARYQNSHFGCLACY